MLAFFRSAIYLSHNENCAGEFETEYNVSLCVPRAAMEALCSLIVHSAVFCSGLYDAIDNFFRIFVSSKKYR